MNVRVAALALVFVAFSVLTDVAVYQHGYIGVFQAALQDTASMQVFVDLCISVSLFGGWMILDARSRGATVWPYVVAIPAVGSFAPLAYLMVREWGTQEAQVPAPA